MWFEEGWTNTFSYYSRIMIPETPRHARNQRPVAPSHLGVHLCAEALGFFFQLQHSSLRWRVASVRLGLIQSSDAQHGCTSEWTADSVHVVPQHETCHGVGWRCKSRILADQFIWKYGVIHHRFATTTSNQLIASCNLYFGWVCAC